MRPELKKIHADIVVLFSNFQKNVLRNKIGLPFRKFMTCETFYRFLNFGALFSCSYYFCRQIFSRPKSGKPGKRRRSFVRKRIQLRTEGSVFSMLRRRLQKGQLMFSQPHCIVELLGALTTLTVRSPRRVQSLLANRVSRSW